MNKKVLANKAFLMAHAINQKKMYKSGKQWIISSALILAMLGAGEVASHHSAYAATTSPATTSAVAKPQAHAIKSTNQSSAAPKATQSSLSTNETAEKGNHLAQRIINNNQQQPKHHNIGLSKVALLNKNKYYNTLPIDNSPLGKIKQGRAWNYLMHGVRSSDFDPNGYKPLPKQPEKKYSLGEGNNVKVGGNKIDYVGNFTVVFETPDNKIISTSQPIDYNHTYPVESHSNDYLFGPSQYFLDTYQSQLKLSKDINTADFKYGYYTTSTQSKTHITKDVMVHPRSADFGENNGNEITESQDYVLHYIANSASPIYVEYINQNGHKFGEHPVSGTYYENGTDITKIDSDNFPKGYTATPKSGETTSYAFGDKSNQSNPMIIHITGKSTSGTVMVHRSESDNSISDYPVAESGKVGDSFTINPSASNIDPSSYAPTKNDSEVTGTFTPSGINIKPITFNYTKEYDYSGASAQATTYASEANSLNDKFNSYENEAASKKATADGYNTIANEYTHPSDITKQATNDDNLASSVSNDANTMNTLASQISSDAQQVANGVSASNQSVTSANVAKALSTWTTMSNQAKTLLTSASDDVNNMKTSGGTKNSFNRVVFETADGTDIGPEFDYYGAPNTNIPYQSDVPSDYELINPKEFKINDYSNNSDKKITDAHIARVQLIPGTNIPATKNPANYWTTIDLHFHDTKSGNTRNIYLYSNNQGVLNDSIDLLNNTGYKPTKGSDVKPTDFQNKVIQGFDTSNFRYNNLTKPSDYEFTVPAKDTENFYGATKYNDKNIVLDFESIPGTNPISNSGITDNIEYINSDGDIINQQQVAGTPGSQFHLVDPSDTSIAPNDLKASDVPNGYHLANNGTALTYDGFTHNVKVEGNTPTANNKNNSIKIMIQREYNGQVVSDTQATNSPMSLSDDHVGNTITFNPSNYIPDDYDIIPSKDMLTPVKINPSDLSSNSKDFNSTTDTITFTYNYDPIKASQNPTAKQNDLVHIEYINQNGKVVKDEPIYIPNGATGNIPNSDMPSDYTPKAPSDTNVTYKGNGTQNQIQPIYVQGKPVKNFTNNNQVTITIELQDKSGVKHAEHQVVDESGKNIGDTFTINPTDRDLNIKPGYTPIDNKPITGVIDKNGAHVNSGTAVFIYNANQSTVTVPARDQNNNPVSIQISGPANSKVTNNELPFGYQLPPNTNYYFNSDGKLVNQSDKPINNINVMGDRINGQAQVILKYNIYGYGTKANTIEHTYYKLADDAQTRLSGRVGDTHTINPVVYAKKGYTIQNSSDDVIHFTSADINPGDSEGSQFRPPVEFDYNAKEVGPIQVEYVDANTKQKIQGSSDIQQINNSDLKNAIYGSNVNLAQDISQNSVNGNLKNVYYVLHLPAGYHLTHAINQVTLAPNGKNVFRTAHGGLMFTVSLMPPKLPNKHLNPIPNNNNGNNTQPVQPSNTSNNNNTSSTTNNDNNSGSVLPQPIHITPITPQTNTQPANNTDNTNNNPVDTGSVTSPVNTTTSNNQPVTNPTTTDTNPVISTPNNSNQSDNTTNSSDIDITPSYNTNHNAKTSSINTPKKNTDISDSTTKTDSDIPATNNITKATTGRNIPTSATNISSDNPVAPTTASDSVEAPNTPITFGSSEPVDNVATTPSVKSNSTNNNTTSKLPQTNEANNYVGVVALITSILGLGLAGIDIDRKHSL